MSNSMNKVILMGNLGADPELRELPTGNLLKLRLATSKKWKDKVTGEPRERTDWHNVTVWGNRARPLHGLLSKGERVMVEGRLQTNTWEDDAGNTKYFTDVRADDIVLAGRREPASVNILTLEAGRKTAPAAPPA